MLSLLPIHAAGGLRLHAKTDPFFFVVVNNGLINPLKKKKKKDLL